MIHEIIDNILDEFGYPYYAGMPIFGDDEPPLYMVYSTWEQPDLFGDGTILSDKYTISLHFICRCEKINECRKLEKLVKQKLLDCRFCFIGSATPSWGTDEPQIRHTVYDYTKNL